MKKSENILFQNNDIDLFKLYLNDIDQYSLLTPEEEYELASNKTEESIKKLVEHNLRLVVTMVKYYRGYGVSDSDLVQLGNMGLITAANKFDINKGSKFSTYAIWWIKQSITCGIADTSRLIRLPHRVHEKVIKLKRVINAYATENFGVEPTNEELSKLTDIPLDKVIHLKKYIESTISLSTLVNYDEPGDITIADMIEDPITTLEEKLYLNDFIKVLLHTNCIDEREKEVLKLRFGLYNGKVYTLSEVGNIFCIAKENVRNIEIRALKKLRKNIEIKRFSPDYFEETCLRDLIKDKKNYILNYNNKEESEKLVYKPLFRN